MEKKQPRYPNRIREYREMMGLTTKQLAQFIGLRREQTLKKWETGTAAPNADYLMRIMVALNVSEQDIYAEYIKKARERWMKYIERLKKRGKLPPDFKLP